MSRQLLPLALATLVAPLAAVLGPLAPLVVEPGPVRAAPQLEISSDGSRWDRTIREPLLDPRVRWVPGDVRSARFLVRSNRADTGDLTVDVVGGQRNAPRDNDYLAVEARAGGGDWTSVDTAGTRRLVEVDGLEGGRPVPVDLLVRLDPQAPNRSMVLATDLELRVTISDSGALDVPVSDPPVGPQTDSQLGALAAAGFDVAPWLPPLGLLLVGTGAFLGTRRRTTRDSTAAPPHVRTPT